MLKKHLSYIRFGLQSPEHIICDTHLKEWQDDEGDQCCSSAAQVLLKCNRHLGPIKASDVPSFPLQQ